MSTGKHESALVPYFDPALDLGELTMAQVDETHVARLLAVSALADACSRMKRRLGPDATAEELAQDKKWCRSIKHRMRSLAEHWAQLVGLTTVGAELSSPLWSTIAADQIRQVIEAKTQVATLAMRTGSRPWGSRRLMLLEQEHAYWQQLVVDQ